MKQESEHLVPSMGLHTLHTCTEEPVCWLIYVGDRRPLPKLCKRWESSDATASSHLKLGVLNKMGSLRSMWSLHGVRMRSSGLPGIV